MFSPSPLTSRFDSRSTLSGPLRDQPAALLGTPTPRSGGLNKVHFLGTLLPVPRPLPRPE